MTDREKTQRMIDVMQAWVDGAEIQARNRRRLSSWDYSGVPHWDWDNYEYRVKPKPREIWVNEYKHRLAVSHYDTQELAKACSDNDGYLGQVLFREVIE